MAAWLLKTYKGVAICEKPDLMPKLTIFERNPLFGCIKGMKYHGQEKLPTWMKLQVGKLTDKDKDSRDQQEGCGDHLAAWSAWA